MATHDFQENCVKYTLFPKINCEEKCIRSFLNDYINDVHAKLAIHLTRYIWQNTGFYLEAILDSKIGPHLQGVTVFDDGVDDEWFIVFLLVELTKSDDQLVVTVEDSDGQFLLIEAANSLPEWVTPETSENRVFLYRGELHLIPPKMFSNINVFNAIEVLRQQNLQTRCDESIQKHIFCRINEFPEKIEHMKHKTRCYVPAAIACLLEEDPSLISHAARAFYTRDAIDLKACKSMKYFPPESRVLANIVMTRCMYSQLICQKYTPDSKVGWNIPAPSASNFKAYDIGMKVACGFEILISGCQRQNESIKCDEKIFNSAIWNRFLSNLKQNGYFKGLMEESSEYNLLFRSAQRYFINLAEFSNEKENKTNCVGEKILKLLKNLDVDHRLMKLKERSLESEDDDGWLNIAPDQLEALLEQKFNVRVTKMASEIPKALKKFVAFNNSGIEGAEFPNNVENESQEIKFDADKIGEALSSILHLKVPHSDSDNSSSGMSDYTDDSSDSDDELRILDKNWRCRQNKEKAAQQDVEENEMKLYMGAMDRELASSNVGLSFERKQPPLAEAEEDSDDSTYAPVDVDLNALKNILESFNSQNGLSGPAGNILSSMEINLPPNNDCCTDKVNDECN